MVKSVFAKMIAGEIPVPIIYEDDVTFAILDQNPLTRGHTLVITKDQIDRLEDCSDGLYAHIFRTVQILSKHLRESLQPLRIALVVHGLDVPHVHIHLVPLYTGDELHLADRPDGMRQDQTEINDLAEVLRQEIKGDRG